MTHTEYTPAEEAFWAAGAGHAEFAWLRKRVAIGGDRAPAERIIELRAIRDAADELLALEVERLRNDEGWPWGRIAECIGVSRQAAQQRYGRKVAVGLEAGEPLW